MSEIAPELVDRCIAFVRETAAHWNTADPIDFNERIAHAAEIVALLPEPIAPDLIAAREWYINRYPSQSLAWLRGPTFVEDHEVQAFMAGLKYARLSPMDGRE